MLREGDITATGQRLKWSVGSEEVLNAAVERSGYLEKRLRARASAAGSSGKNKAYGIGLSFFFHGAGFTGAGEAKMEAKAGLEVTADGRARVLSGSTEIGQGTRTIFCQIVSDELGVDFEDIEMAEPDTSRVPDSGPTVASRTCMVVGRVVQLAAREIKEKLLQLCRRTLWRAGGVRLVESYFVLNGRRLATLAEVAQRIHRPARRLARLRPIRKPARHQLERRDVFR